MGITKTRLREIIIEEYQKVLKEGWTDKEFIADQLVNAWEHNSEKEMFSHLAKQTKVDKAALKKVVHAWYVPGIGNKKRNDILGPKNASIDAFVGGFIK